MSEGRKFDSEKPRTDLLSPIALIEIAKVMSHGAKKYDAHNWRKGIAWSRLLGAALRHLLAFLGGEDKDPESGLSHLAHLGCCIMFLLEFEVTRLDLDDRYKGNINTIARDFMNTKQEKLGKEKEVINENNQID